MRLFAAVAAVCLTQLVALAAPVTYQGVLRDAGVPASGTYDMLFDLYTDATPGGPDVIVATEFVANVPVTRGVFTVEIPFNPLAFNGEDRFLQIGCRPAGGGAFTTLLPRQQLADAPEAVHADVADTLSLPAELVGFTTEPTQGVLYVENTLINSGSAIKARSTWSAIRAEAGTPTDVPIVAAAPIGVSAVGEATGVSGASGSGVGVVGAAASGTGGSFMTTGTGTGLRAFNASNAPDGLPAEIRNNALTGTEPALSVVTASTRANAYGVHAVVESTNPGSYSAAVRAENNGTGGLGIGVHASHDGNGWGVLGESTSGVGIYGASTSGTAGYFGGNVTVTGTLAKGAGTFKIDHPLDPANKYLSHSFVESPDMKNIYDGVITLDDAGRAEVGLPDYFEALNEDFRYQLTCLGGHAPVYIEREISANTFVIAGGNPGMRVSWQVTGSRKDAFARSNPVIVEQDKPADERGMYLHPEAHGQPAELGVMRRPSN